MSIPPLHPCRWEWCRSTFQSKNLLISHVRDEHIKTASAIRRSDVSLFLRAYEGASFNETSFTNSSVVTQSTAPEAKRPSFAELTRESDTRTTPSPPPIPPSPSTNTLLQQHRFRRGIPDSPSQLDPRGSPAPASALATDSIEKEADKMMNEYIRSSPTPGSASDNLQQPLKRVTRSKSRQVSGRASPASRPSSTPKKKSRKSPSPQSFTLATQAPIPDHYFSQITDIQSQVIPEIEESQ